MIKKDWQWLKVITLLTIILAFFISCLGTQVKTGPQPVEKLVKISTPPKGSEVATDSVIITPDINHIAYVIKAKDGMQVVVDNTPQRVYDKILKGTPIFSPKKDRIAYVAGTANKWFVVIDGKEGPQYKKVDDLCFSPDGTKVAYRALNDKGKQFIVLNGKKGPLLDGISDEFALDFSPDSQKLVYVGIAGTTLVVVKHEGDKDVMYQVPGSVIREPIFSPNSEHLAYMYHQKGKWGVMLDGRKGPLFDAVKYITFSPDSKHIAYVAQDGKKFYVLLDGKKGSELDMVGMPAFSPDSKRFAVGVMKNKKWYVLIDGKPGKAYDGLHFFVFSQDSQYYAYNARIDDKWHMVVDGKEAKGYKALGKPVFSPNSKRFGYVALDDGRMFAVIDGKEGNRYDLIGISTGNIFNRKISDMYPFFSPDSENVAYIAVVGDTHFMVINDAVGPYFDSVSIPYFSQDGKQIAYKGYNDKECKLVVNGHELPAVFTSALKSAPLVYDSDENDMDGIFLKDDSFVKVEVSVP